MSLDSLRATLRERIEAGATLEELDTILRTTRGLRPEEHSKLLAFAWTYEPAAPAALAECPA